MNHSDWTLKQLEAIDLKIAKIATQFKLDTYPNQIEVIGAEQMMDHYSSVGMPLGYHHWSFGKQYLKIEKQYKRGLMGLAYELVINANPCITYLMEENSYAMQVLVIAHACYGHNAFFKNNYLFKTWTSADSIIDYLVFAKTYIAQCEQRYGYSEVETLLDACHALMNQGVDRYRHPKKLSIQEEAIRQTKRSEYLQSQVNELWRTIPKKEKSDSKEHTRFPAQPEENILYFIEKNAPLLEPWQREIVRIVRKIAQYFYPQKQTKVMNEGWATFWHYQILNTLYKKGTLDDALMIEFLHNHTNVIYQPPFHNQYFSGMNPYTLGFAMFQDLKRICETPTQEDRTWFSDWVGKDWLETVHFAMENFKDESFIVQFLSPKVIRDLKLFSLLDDETQNTLKITHIHNDSGFQPIREQLAKQYNLSSIEPNIQVYQVNNLGDRSITLRHYLENNIPLSKASGEVMKHVYQLWGFTVKLETINEQGTVISTQQCPPEPPALELEKEDSKS